MNRSIKNKYIKSAHISEQKFREILKGFAADLTAQSVAILVGVSRNSINQLYKKFRLRILQMTSIKTDFSVMIIIEFFIMIMNLLAEIMNLLAEKIMLMVLNHFGLLPKEEWPNLMV